MPAVLPLLGTCVILGHLLSVATKRPDQEEEQDINKILQKYQ
jgi:hypothetical protein